jgi:hypothetical protein
LMQRLADQNINFLRSLLPGVPGTTATDPDAKQSADSTKERDEPNPPPADNSSQATLR